jgi:hypothetical protein
MKQHKLVTLDTEAERLPSRPPSPWIRKPLHTVLANNESHERTPLVSNSDCNHSDQHFDSGNAAFLETKTHTLQRHLSLLDLVSIGIGGTVGSGLFVLCGLVAHEYAGPSTFWLRSLHQWMLLRRNGLTGPCCRIRLCILLCEYGGAPCCVGGNVPHLGVRHGSIRSVTILG